MKADAEAAVKLGGMKSLEFSGGVLTVTYKLAELDEDSAVFSAMEALFYAPRTVFKNPALQKLSLIGKATFKDKFGALNEGDGIRIFVTRELAEKIQWDNVTRKDVAKLVVAREGGSDVWVHPAFKPAWAARLAE
jgi:hypothetical protein